MKLLLLALLTLFSGSPAIADYADSESQAGYSSSRTCTRNEYREEYVPGTQLSPGYVKSWTETVEVPCTSTGATTVRPAIPQQVDNNDCSEGTVAGGLLGGGLATAVSRGKDRWWAIPAGAVGGAMIGCQIDGG